MATSLTDAQVQEAADFLLATRATGGSIDPIPEGCRPATIADGCRVSEVVARGLNKRPVGWKAGASSPAAMRELGSDAPPSGPLYDGMLRDSPAQLRAADYQTCVIEAEIAFRLAHDLPPRDAPYTEDEVRDAVASAHIAIEAPNVRFAAGREIGLPSIIADGFAAQSLVIGPAIERWREDDLTKLDVELLFDGDVIARGFEGDARCDPLAVLRAVANDLSRRGMGLAAGQVVTTGAAAPATPAQPGQTAIARFAGIGDVVATLA